MYPIPFRALSKKHRYKKYQWIEADLEKNTSDPRIESYKIIGDIIPLEIIDTKKDWHLRKQLLLHNVYTNKLQLIYDCRHSEKQTSLAIFKPAKLIGFHIEDVNITDKICDTYKLPFKFYYKFADDEGKVSRLQMIDWEIGELHENF